MNYKNNIILGIKLDTQNQVETNLNGIIEKLNNREINLDVKINQNAIQSLKSISDVLDVIKSKSNTIPLGDFDKAIKSSTTGLSKLNGELLKASQTNYGNGSKKIITETATAIGETVTQTQKFNKDNTIMGDGVAKTTTNFIEQAKAIKDVEKAQESLNNLKLVDKNKIADLKNLLNLENIGSTNELSNLLNQVKQLENEEQKLSQIQKDQINLANQMANLREKSEINSKARDESWKLEQAKAINKSKEENYKATQKEAEAEKEVQQQIQNKIKLLEIQKSSLQRQYGDKIDTSFVDQAINKLKLLDSISLKDLKNEFKNIDIGIKQTVEQVKQGESVFSKLQSTLGSLGMYISGAVIFRGIINQIKNGIEYVKYLDSSFTDMAMTMDISRSKFNALSESIDNMGKKLGINSREIHDIGRVYANAQSSTEEILAKLKSASELSNISGMSGLETTKTLQSTVNAFDLLTEAEGSNEKATQRIGDVFTEVSKNMAYDFQTGIIELNNAIKESGSVAKESGMSLEQYSSYMGALIERTGKTGSELGTFWKMLTARVQQIKSVGDEIGITTKEMGKAEQALTSIGVSIRGQNGSLRNMDSILKDTYSQWDKLNDQQKSYVAEGVAGNRHRATFLSLMKAMTSEQNLYNKALNSTGALEQANEVKAKSFEGKMNTMKDTVQELYSTLINGEVLKGGISIFTNIISGVNSLVKTLGTIPSTIAIVSASLTAFNSKFNNYMKSIQPNFLKGWIEGINNYRTKLISTDKTEQQSIAYKKANINVLKEQIATQKVMSSEYVVSKAKLVQLQGGLIATTVAEKACAIATKALGLAFNIAVGLGVGLAISCLSHWINKTEETKQANEQLLSSIQSLKTDISDISKLKEQVSSLTTEIQKNGQSAEETKKKKKELASVYEQLIQKSPELEGKLNSENGKYEEQKDAINKVILAKKEQLALESEKYINSNNVNDSSIQKELDKLNELKTKLKEYDNLSIGDKQDYKDKFGFLPSDQLLAEKQEKYKRFATNIREQVSSVKNALQEKVDNQKIVNDLGLNTGMSSDMFKKVNEELTSTTLYGNQAKDSLSQLQSQGENTTDSLKAGFNESSNSVKSFDDKLKGVSDTFNSLNGNIDIIDKVIKEMSELGGITSGTYEQLISKNPEVLACLVKEGNTIENLKTLRHQDMQLMEEKKNEAVRLADEEYNHKVANNQAETESNSVMNQNKSKNDADFNNQSRENSSETTNQNGGNYQTDSGNFNNTSNVKLTSDAGFQNGWRTNTADSVNQMGDMYQTDMVNFQGSCNSKMSMLSAFKSKFANMANAMTLDDAVGIRLSDKLSGVGSQFNSELRDSMGKIVGADLNAMYEENMKKTQNAFRKVANSIDTSNIPLVSAGISKVAPSIASGGGSSSGGGGSKGGSGGHSGKSDTEKEVEKAQKLAEDISKMKVDLKPDRYLDLNNALEQINNSLTENKTLQESLYGDELQKAKTNEIELMKQKQKALENLNIERRKEADEIKDYLSKYQFYFDENGEIINSQQRLKEIADSVNAMGGNTEEDKKKKQEWIDWVKELEKKTQDYCNLVDKELPKTTDEFNQLGNAIKKASEEMSLSLRDKIVEALKEKYEKEQKKSDELDKKKRKKEIEALDEKIKKLKKQLADLDDSKEDKLRKLHALEKELNDWEKDNSTESVKK